MAKRYLWVLLLVPGFLARSGAPMRAQENTSSFRVTVDLVQLNVAVTDSKGNYVTGLRPQDFVITEDSISQNIATFAEGNAPARQLLDFTQSTPNFKLVAPNLLQGPASPSEDSGNEANGGPPQLGSLVAGANVFVLFDTSNYMYRGFALAQDAISQFVRSLDRADRIALYSYSRNFSRSARLTSDRAAVLRGVRSTVAGDDASLYNALLMTIKDAAQYSGRKVIVVFSNGPDNSSMVSPEDVAELAQSESIPIYMISTREAKLEPISTVVFQRMSATTGGKAYFAKNWKQQQQAFDSIRTDLAHLYTLSYYPQFNPNRGWRTISVKLVGEKLKKYRIRTRSGYRLSPAQVSAPGGKLAP
jgi:Ca-activated chloride channel homolog